jgi:hypothetical protein
MSENMEKFRSLDGSHALVDLPFIRIIFQHGSPSSVGVNGCSIEDVIEVLVQRLLDFQGRSLACEENATALYHLEEAREALLLRRRRRQEQGVLGFNQPHKATDPAQR